MNRTSQIVPWVALGLLLALLLGVNGYERGWFGAGTPDSAETESTSVDGVKTAVAPPSGETGLDEAAQTQATGDMAGAEPDRQVQPQQPEPSGQAETAPSAASQDMAVSAPRTPANTGPADTGRADAGPAGTGPVDTPATGEQADSRGAAAADTAAAPAADASNPEAASQTPRSTGEEGTPNVALATPETGADRPPADMPDIDPQAAGQAPEAPAPAAPAPEGPAPEATAPEATAPEATAPETAAPAASAPAASSAAQQPPGPAAPTFDIARVEPGGAAVFAGRAEPGWTVSLRANARTVGKAIADALGDWVIVLENPLAGGDYDITAWATSRDGTRTVQSPQRLAVSIPDKPGEGALVALAEPGEATRVLSKPEPDGGSPSGQADLPSQSAAGTAAPAGAPPAEGEAGTQPIAAAPVVTGTGATPVPQSGPGEGSAGESVAEAQSSPPDLAPVRSETAMVETAADAASTAAPSPTSPGAVTNAAPPAGVATSATSPAATDTAMTTAGPDASGASAMTPPAAPAGPEPAGPEMVPEISLGAVEVEDSQIYIAGTAPPGAEVRLYIDDAFVGVATADENGAFLYEGEYRLGPGSYRVRADEVGPGSEEVLARAEVTFERAPDAVAMRPVSRPDGPPGAVAAAEDDRPETVIIRRGDNLWNIARRVYGRGIRYTTIYQANRDQIRDPHWIYPGQVFTLPRAASDG